MENTYLISCGCMLLCNFENSGDGVVLGQSLMVKTTLLLCISISPLLCIVRFVVVYM